MRRMTPRPLLLVCFFAASCVTQSPRPTHPVPVTMDARQLPATVATGWTAAALHPPGMLYPLPPDPANPGIARKYFKTMPNTSLSAHRHSADMRITVLTGRQYILMGDLDRARVQHFDPGTTFVIPAGVWHVEWFESETLAEIEIAASSTTEIASPATPRVP